MDIVISIIGLFFIGLGFVVKSNPGLIAGYNTMPKEKQKNVDIPGLSTFMRNALIVIGLATILAYFLFKWTGFPILAFSMILLVPVSGLTFMIIMAQKFDHNKNRET